MRELVLSRFSLFRFDDKKESKILEHRARKITRVQVWQSLGRQVLVASSIEARYAANKQRGRVSQQAPQEHANID